MRHVISPEVVNPLLEKVKTIVDDIFEMMAKVEDRTPYIVVCFQVPPSYFALASICNVFRRVSE